MECVCMGLKLCDWTLSQDNELQDCTCCIGEGRREGGRERKEREKVEEMGEREGRQERWERAGRWERGRDRGQGGMLKDRDHQYINGIINLTYSLSFWLQMSESISHMDIDNYMILMHWKCVWMFCMNWCYIYEFFQCIWIVLGEVQGIYMNFSDVQLKKPTVWIQFEKYVQQSFRLHLDIWKYLTKFRDIDVHWKYL